MFALTNDRTRAKRIREGKGKAVLLYVGFDQKLALVEKDRRWNVHICGPCSYQESSPRYIYIYIYMYIYPSTKIELNQRYKQLSNLVEVDILCQLLNKPKTQNK